MVICRHFSQAVTQPCGSFPKRRDDREKLLNKGWKTRKEALAELRELRRQRDELNQLRAYLAETSSKCPGCGKLFEPRWDKKYCEIGCGARARHYLRQGRAMPAETRRHLTGEEKRRRDAEVLAARARGESLRRVGEAFRISKQRVAQIEREHQQAA